MTSLTAQLYEAQRQFERAPDDEVERPVVQKRKPLVDWRTRNELRKLRGRPELRYREVDPHTLRWNGRYTNREPDPLYVLRAMRSSVARPAWPSANLRSTPDEAANDWIARQVAYGAACSQAYSPVFLPEIKAARGDA